MWPSLCLAAESEAALRPTLPSTHLPRRTAVIQWMDCNEASGQHAHTAASVALGACTSRAHQGQR